MINNIVFNISKRFINKYIDNKKKKPRLNKKFIYFIIDNNINFAILLTF